MKIQQLTLLLWKINVKLTGESHLVRDSGRYPLCGRG